MPLPVSSTSSTLIWTDAWSLAVIRRLVAAPAAGSAPCSRPPRRRTLARDVEVDDLASVVLHGELGESEIKSGRIAVATQWRGQRRGPRQPYGLQQPRRAQTSVVRATARDAKVRSSRKARVASTKQLLTGGVREASWVSPAALRTRWTQGHVFSGRASGPTRVGRRVQNTASGHWKRQRGRENTPLDSRLIAERRRHLPRPTR